MKPNINQTQRAAPKDLHSQFRDNGVIFVPHLIDEPTVARLQLIVEHCLCQWRIDEAARGVPDETLARHNVMRHLNNSIYYAGRRGWLTELLDVVADPAILAVVGEVLGDEVLFRSTSLFMNPLGSTNDGDWHRDTQFGIPADEEKSLVLRESEDLLRTQRIGGIQLQIALVPNDDVEYVPGSHLRWDTKAEFHIRRSNDFKFNRSNHMPGAVRLSQAQGDAVAFHSNGLHRGRYHADRYRRTLMLTYNAFHGKHYQDIFSDQPWCLQNDYLDGVKPSTRAFFERFITTYRDFWQRKRIGKNGGSDVAGDDKKNI